GVGEVASEQCEERILGAGSAVHRVHRRALMVEVAAGDEADAAGIARGGAEAVDLVVTLQPELDVRARRKVPERRGVDLMTARREWRPDDADAAPRAFTLGPELDLLRPPAPLF